MEKFISANAIKYLLFVYVMILIIFIPSYFIGMFLYPLIAGGASWSHLQNVWQNWQGLNVGVLALISSGVALTLTIRSEQKKNASALYAAKAFIPAALSEITLYLKACTKVADTAWINNNIKQYRKTFTSPKPHFELNLKAVFKEVMKLTDIDIAEHLGEIIIDLQVIDSRIAELHASFKSGHEHRFDKSYLLTIAYSLCKLQSLVDETYPFSRSETKIIKRMIDNRSLKNSYKVLKFEHIKFEHIYELFENMINSEKTTD